MMQRVIAVEVVGGLLYLRPVLLLEIKRVIYVLTFLVNNVRIIDLVLLFGALKVLLLGVALAELLGHYLLLIDVEFKRAINVFVFNPS